MSLSNPVHPVTKPVMYWMLICLNYDAGPTL